MGRKKRPGHCTVYGCKRTYKMRYLTDPSLPDGPRWVCGAHTYRWLRYGAFEAGLPIYSRNRKKQTCLVDSCGNKSHAWGFCSRHYQDFREGEYVLVRDGEELTYEELRGSSDGRFKASSNGDKPSPESSELIGEEKRPGAKITVLIEIAGQMVEFEGHLQ